MQNFLKPDEPALVLAPMEGVTDFPMRLMLTKRGGFDYCVTEFFRISQNVPFEKTFIQHVPELKSQSKTAAGVPVQVQLLGGDPEKLALAASRMVQAGALGIDLNFGCPAPTVNRHDGGATLLKYPDRICKIVSTVRQALPTPIPVSAKLRLGWENPEDILENAVQAEKGGASWITIHARTKIQGYKPPAFWKYIGQAKKQVSIPVIANGDLWTLEDLLICQEQTGCIHFMIGRSALANPILPLEISHYLKTGKIEKFDFPHTPLFWKPILKEFNDHCQTLTSKPGFSIARIKQWLSMSSLKNPAEWITHVKRAQSLDEIFSILS